MKYAVVIEKAESNYSAYVPDLPGCVATGTTLEEVEREIREAIGFHIEGLYLYVVNAMTMALRKYQREAGVGRGSSGSFRSGYITAVIESLEQALRDKRAEMQSASASRALVVSKANAVAERFGPQKEKTTRSSVHDGGAFFSGLAEGRKLDIGRRGVTGSSDTAVRLGA